ncbi:MAG: hypothetical protein IT184_01300 [Acidobacteria bacterium]|nr:hypothetical protein [Acidobacteriota bacterium]
MRQPIRALTAAGPVLIFAGVLLLQIHEAPGVVHAQGAASLPERRAEMAHHFLQITKVHEAVIRGDLAAVRPPARELAEIELPAGLPPTSQPFLFPIRVAGRRAAEATNLAQAARATATLFAECGECHRTAGVRPAIARRATPDVGGLVGHMLEHLQAVHLLEQGLFVPSSTDWQLGAERLETAPLAAADLPPDHRLTKEIRAAETRVHKAAARAAAADTAPERVAAYAVILGSCAECHQLHRKLWGPKTLP